jgi:predicted ATPase
MSMFKLVAIRPLENCHPDFHKNLKPGRPYPFYQDFVFDLEGDGVYSIRYTRTVPQDLYRGDSKTKPHIDISAVVGKNGAGKSTLLELLYAFNYVISVKAGILDSGIEPSEFDAMKEQVQVELYYMHDDSMYRISTRDEKPHVTEFWDTEINPTTSVYRPGLTDPWVPSKFFYSIAVNYSLHGLNSEQMGNWVRDLFHKNDGYRAPLVINPMRTKGNIDMNKEHSFAESRLLANLAFQALNGPMVVVEEKAIERIDFSWDEKKLEECQGRKLDDILKMLKREYGHDLLGMLELVYHAFAKGDSLYENFRELIPHIPHAELIARYTVRKLVNIAYTYPEYRHFKITPESDNPTADLVDLNAYVSLLADDRSHITLKLRQIVNIIRFNTLRGPNPQDPGRWEGNVLTLTAEEYAERLRNALLYHVPPGELADLVPNAFFTSDIYVRDHAHGSAGRISPLYKLSSGEQQFIHALQSVYYHLANIDSVSKSADDGKSMNAYHHVNIVLDEIELYFHPEFQQKFIHELCEGIRRMPLDHVRAVNILLATHSPFILSDIPGANMLRLEDGSIETKKNNRTLGANIHELLHEDFLLKDTFMGVWAKKYILKLIDDIEKWPLTEPAISASDLHEKIDLIGEPFIRKKLIEQLHEQVSKSSSS